MLLVIVILLVLCIGFGLWYDEIESISEGMKSSIASHIFMLCTFCGIASLILSIFFIGCHFRIHAEISTFKSIQTILDTQWEADMSEYERERLTNKMINTKKWLIKAKDLNKTIFGDMIPDEIEELTLRKR